AQGNHSKVAYATNPSAPIRWVNQWDDMDGRIERGYGGPSIFFKDGQVVDDLTRVAEYARLLASIRINAVVINNVNANATLLSPTNLDGVARIADVFRPYGVQVGLSLNFASPQTYGGLSTFDPLDASVVEWWSKITAQVYDRVPDMAGY
ncbi:alpha-glucuronidase, partial [Streptomyces albiflaviniger]|nr:alpha-glucuronidase [Streptomyces albiflaviniger]